MNEPKENKPFSDKEKESYNDPFDLLNTEDPSQSIPYQKDFEFGSLYHDRIAAIEEFAHADPTNIQQVAAFQLTIVNSYYESGLYQSRQSFRWSLIWGGVGFLFLIVAVAVLILRQPSEGALASGIAGAVVEMFAGTYLYLYKHASDQLAAFRSSLERTQYVLLTNSMCESLVGEHKQQMKTELIRCIFDLISAKASPEDRGLGEKS